MDPGPTPDPPRDIATLRAQYQRLRLLYQVSNVIHSTLEPQEALRLILREAVRLMKASSGSLALVNPTTGFLEIQASFGLPARASQLKLKIGEGITGFVAQTGKPVRLGEVSHHPRYIPLRQNIRSELAVPLEVNGELRGVLNVDSDRPHAFSAQDQELLEELAFQAAKVIHNTWLYEQLRLKARLFESLVNVGHVINSTQSLDESLQVIAREGCLLMGAKMCSLLLLDAEQEFLELRASHGAGQAYIQKPQVSVADSLLGIVIRRQKPLQIENVQISSRYQSVEIARQEGLVSLLSVPLTFRNQPTGVISVYTGHPHSFSNEEIRILSAMGDLSAIAIEKARLHEQIVNIEEQLRQNEKLSALGLLAAEVAHEIRNPLTVMKMLYHSLDLRFENEDPRRRDAAIIQEKMDLLNRIVEQILDFARSTEPKPSRINVNQLVDTLSLLTRHKLRNQQIQLKHLLQENLPLINADAAQLEQAFLNLTLNAVEAMPNGGTLTIRTRVMHIPKKSPSPTHVQVEFKDTGHGMTQEQRKRSFTSLLSTGKPQGTGLGLAIVARIVETHRGKVSVRSRPNKGTTFQILLPV